MKKSILALFLILAVSLTACEKIKTIQGSEGVSISGYIDDCAYLKINPVMSGCCEEYDLVTPHIKEVENVSSYQIYGIDMYNEENKEIDPNGDITISIILSDEIKKADGDNYNVYKLDDNDNFIKMNSNELSGVITFESDSDGIYTIVKTNSSGSTEASYAVTNCNGGCSGCGGN